MNNFSYYSNQCRQSPCFDLRGIQTNDTAETQRRQYCAMQVSGGMFNIKHFAEPVGHAVVQLIEALCYMPEVRGFDFRWRF